MSHQCGTGDSDTECPVCKVQFDRARAEGAAQEREKWEVERRALIQACRTDAAMKIAEEREACAQVADTYVRTSKAGGYRAAQQACEVVRDAIRALKEKP